VGVSSFTTRKRKASAQLSSNKVAGKKAKRKSKNHEQPDPILPEAAIDTNMDLVLQLKTTPRKSATLVKPTCQDTLDNIPNALGLVSKEAVPEINETFITPSKPLDNIDRKKTPRKAVQRNLLDDVELKSPGLSPARSSLTPIKLTPSPGKSSHQIASAKKISLSPKVDLIEKTTASVSGHSKNVLSSSDEDIISSLKNQLAAKDKKLAAKDKKIRELLKKVSSCLNV
jgi:hypothetical protein